MLLAMLFTGCGKDYVDPNGGGTNAGTNAGTSGSLARFAISNNTLYTVSPFTLTSYDISDNTNPVIQKTNNLNSRVETIFGTPNYLYIGTQTGMLIYDVSNAPAPVYTGSYSHFRSCDPVVANANYAFESLRSSSPCTLGLNEIDVVDIATNPKLPKLVYTYPMTQPFGLALDGNYLFVCDGGVKLYDISNLATPVLKQKIVIAATDIIAQNGHIMVTGDDGIYQYDYTSGTMVLLSHIITK